MLGDTIAAISTPHGKGGVALLRVSGDEAVSVCEKVFEPRNGKKLSEVPPRTAVYGRIFSLSPNREREAVDDGIATVFKAPASFTGEDTVEICCHGGILLTQTILSSLLASGARMAAAGEFTRRAFLNGKMGLSAAEALADILEAGTREQILLAHNGMNGKIEAATRGIYEKLRAVLAAVYAKIDYPDEDLTELSDAEILERVGEAETEVENLLATYRTGHAIAEGIRTVICGKPNVGKSSLYNRIVGRDAAIVTEIEGTTRDLLTETAALGKVTLRLCDTAGLRESLDRVEKIGIERARVEMEKAELIFALFDASRPFGKEDFELLEELKKASAEVILILNKCDRAENENPGFPPDGFAHVIRLSAATGEGMEELKNTVEVLFTDGKISLSDDAVLTNARQEAAALSALEALRRGREAIAGGLPLELGCSDFEAAMASLGEIDGREVSEDIVSSIFSHFCVGK